MAIREDILDELTAEQVTKNHGEPMQGDINLVKQELGEQVAKLKTTEDVSEKGKKWIFSGGLRKKQIWHSNW